jgi:hypothetical protein
LALKFPLDRKLHVPLNLRRNIIIYEMLQFSDAFFKIKNVIRGPGTVISTPLAQQRIDYA